MSDENIDAPVDPVQNTDDDGLDAALEKIGGHTCWTWKVYFATGLCNIFNIWTIIAWIFIAEHVDYRCEISELDAVGWSAQQQRNLTGNPDYKDICAIPELDYQRLSQMEYEEAWKTARNEISEVACVKCKEFVFETPENSIMAEFNLVCDRLIFLAHQQMIIGVGMAVGAIAFGIIADKYGRKTGFIIGSIVYFVCGPIPFFVPRYWVLFSIRFFLGFATCMYITGLTLLLECVRKNLRDVFTMLYNIIWAVGQVLLAVIAYFVRPWKTLQATISFPTALLFISCVVIPESPRWLATRGKRTAAWKIVLKADKSLVPTGQVRDSTVSHQRIPIREKLRLARHRLNTMCKNRDLCLRLFICCLLWWFTILTYYVLTLNATNFGSNIYIYSALSGVIEGACYALSIVILKYLGRRVACVLLYLTGGSALLLIIFVPDNQQGAIIFLAMTGRFCNSTVSAVVGLITSELFPTEIRSISTGICSAVARMGPISSPYLVVNVGSVNKTIPALICGATSIACVVLVLLLPETKGRPLRDSVQEMIEDEKKGHKVSIRNMRSFK